MLAAVLASQILVYLLIFRVFDATTTQIVTCVFNTLACCVLPLDQLDKLLKTSDLNLVNYPMNILNAFSCMIWGTFHLGKGAYQLSFANYSGFICVLALLIGAMQANGQLPKNSLLVSMARSFVNVLYKRPLALIISEKEAKKTPRKSTPSKSRHPEFKS